MLRLTNLLGSPAPELSLNGGLNSEQDVGSQAVSRLFLLLALYLPIGNFQGKKARNRSRLIESPGYEPESFAGPSTRPNRSDSALVDFDSDGVTDEPCKYGQRQRIAYVEIPPFCRKSPSHKKAFTFLDLPPLPSKTLRKAAIAARHIVMNAVMDTLAARHENTDEGEPPVASDEEVAADEVVIAGDRFLTRDYDAVSSIEQ